MTSIQHRVTQRILRSGQPRPYADTEFVAQLVFEINSPYGRPEERNIWRPQLKTEAQAFLAITSFGNATTRAKSARKDAFSSYLDYFKPVDPKTVDSFGRESPTGTAIRSSVWEFRVVSPFTD